MRAEIARIYEYLKEQGAQEDDHIAGLQEAVRELERKVRALESSLEQSRRESQADGALREKISGLERRVAGFESALQPPAEDFSGWPEELLSQIDWTRWGRTPPGSGA